MFFKNIKVSGLGPFADLTELQIEENLTVITGRNDVGKSFMLRLLHLLCAGKPIDEKDANLFRMYAADKSWNENPELKCQVVANLTSSFCKYVPEGQQGDEVTIDFRLAPITFSNQIVSHIRGNSKLKYSRVQRMGKMPRAIWFPSEYEIGSSINLTDPNPVERCFLQQAFGGNFAKKLDTQNRLLQKSALRQASDVVTSQLAKILPSGMSMTLEFELDGTDLLVYTADACMGSCPLDFRGTGIRKILSILFQLLSLERNEQTLLLFDEPENGLHADAQHELRRFLEGLAVSEAIQVIYATHSPSMINPMRPATLRLFEQKTANDEDSNLYATTIIKNRPVHENLFFVRQSLGLWPSDSLLYAPITIVVEGITETLCLPYLLQRLNKEGIDGFQDLADTAGLLSFCDGGGNNYVYVTEVAITNRCKPIVFLDGDKNNPNKVEKVRKNHPEVPIIYLEQTEFEEILPREKYFQALGKVMDKNDINLEDFETWVQEQVKSEDRQKKNIPDRAFTKQLEAWLAETHNDIVYQKAEVMNEAVKLVDVKEVDTTKLLELVQANRHHFQGTIWHKVTAYTLRTP